MQMSLSLGHARAAHPPPHPLFPTHTSADSPDPASENSCPRNSLLRRARDPVQSDDRPIHESAIPVGCRPESASPSSPGIAPRHAAPPPLPQSPPRFSPNPAIQSVRTLATHAVRQNYWDTNAMDFPHS